MSSLKSSSHIMAGWDLNFGILAPREHTIYSLLFNTVPKIAGSSEIAVVKAGGGQRTKYDENRDGCTSCLQEHPNWAPLGSSWCVWCVSATAAVSVGADWQGGQFRSR